MKNSSGHRLAWLLPTLPALCGLLLLIAEPLPLQALRNNLFDQYQRWSPREYQAAPVRIIDIDDASLARLGQWPWPRTRMAEMVDRLNQAGVAAIAFEEFFDFQAIFPVDRRKPGLNQPAQIARGYGPLLWLRRVRHQPGSGCDRVKDHFQWSSQRPH